MLFGEGPGTRHGLLRREVGVVLRGVVQTVDTNFAAGIFRTERKRGKIPRLGTGRVCVRITQVCVCMCVCVHENEEGSSPTTDGRLLLMVRVN